MAQPHNHGRRGQLFWKQTLIRLRPDIVKILDVNDIKDYLISKNVLTLNVAERIMIPLESKTRSDSVGLLLDYLRRRTEADYRIFVGSLEEPNKDLYDRLMTYEPGRIGNRISVLTIDPVCDFSSIKS